MRGSMHRRLVPLLVLAMVLALVPVAPASAFYVGPQTIYVNAATGSDVTGDGSAASPFKSMSAGLAAANGGDTVMVAEGTYSTAETGEMFPLTIDQGDLTIIGDGSDTTIVDSAFIGGVLVIGSSDYISGISISGLTLTQGETMDGGAAHIYNAAVAFDECVMTGNTAGQGGAIAASASNVTLTDCTLAENGSYSVIFPNAVKPTDATCILGGAVYAENSTLGVYGCTVAGNNATNAGGAFALLACTADVSGSAFFDNATVGSTIPLSTDDFFKSGLMPASPFPGGFGGAIMTSQGVLTMDDCGFFSNTALLGSSIMGLDASVGVQNSLFESDECLAGVTCSVGDSFLSMSDSGSAEIKPTIALPTAELNLDSCTFQTNNGAPVAMQTSAGLVRNCLVTNNVSDQATLLFVDASADIVNTTLANNMTDGYPIMADVLEPGSVVPTPTGVRVANSIVWDENPTSVFGASVVSSDLRGMEPVEPASYDDSVISEDPEFSDPESGDYSLSAGSPCIDTGADFDLAPETDIDGTPRPIDGDASGTAEWDMGAYEFGAATDGRIEGTDRYETSVAISEDHFDSADTAVLATGRIFADGLAAAGLAGVYDAPVLLTQPKVLPAAVAGELVRLGVSHVIICGDQRAVSDSVADAVAALGDIEVERIGGADRYETAALLAEEIVNVTGDDPGLVFVARGDTFPDALAVSPIAWAYGAPVVLVRPDELPRYTMDYLLGLAGTTRGVIVGGDAAVSLGVQGQITAQAAPAFERISGVDRYDTAAEVAYWADDQGLADFGVTGVATGEDFADALSAGPGIGASGGVLLLTPRHSAAEPTLDAISSYGPSISALQIFGSGAAIDDDVAAELDAARYLP